AGEDEVGDPGRAGEGRQGHRPAVTVGEREGRDLAENRRRGRAGETAPAGGDRHPEEDCHEHGPEHDPPDWDGGHSTLPPRVTKRSAAKAASARAAVIATGVATDVVAARVPRRAAMP